MQLGAKNLVSLMKAKILLCLLVAGAFLPVLAAGAEPPSAPVLRIEAWTYTASIKHIAMYEAGRLVLTTSADSRRGKSQRCPYQLTTVSRFARSC